MDNILSPIVLFVYNRFEHTVKTLQSLQKNELANQSELFIYSDAPKDETAFGEVYRVREYIKTIDGFKKVTIIQRDKNWGLANSIIDGVTKIINQYGKIIVLEDDLVTSPYFLKFMNEALEYYENSQDIWHISGWNYPIQTTNTENVFCWRLMNCWGWATWAKKWNHYEKNVSKLISEFNNEDIHKFNLDGVENFWNQVLQNKNNKINTWAIFWYATIFKKGGLCINPSQTFVENIGHDGSGVHCAKNDSFSSQLSVKGNIKYQPQSKENLIVVDKIKHFYKINKRSLLTRILNKVSRKIIGKNLIK
ncbi:MAG: sugar transferase [uncultured Campylobacterales bacterium]|uniref:Sugar transferase n=1 Tax=uncultured Campylobacterales bacterium TaxID=352960 RepID=A0A6S6SUQ7_9BACT|nr:MAG: sugar transferase [uncultured Campylobacterales bacterium]